MSSAYGGDGPAAAHVRLSFRSSDRMPELAAAGRSAALDKLWTGAAVPGQRVDTLAQRILAQGRAIPSVVTATRPSRTAASNGAMRA